MDHALFLLKKILGDFLSPVPVTLLLLLFALLTLMRRKGRWFGLLCLLLALAILFTASYPPLSQRLMEPYESRYPAYELSDQHHDYVSVLGNWHQTTEEQPVTSELGPTAIVRLAEGIRVYRLNPGSRLIFTGFHGVDEDPVSFPDKLKELAVALGVPETDILTFNGPRDTAEEAQLIGDLFPDDSLVLVTSASHMPRAMALFRGAGLEPTPAPTGHLSKPDSRWWKFPDAKTLAKTELWLHEQLGQIWARLMGQSGEKTEPTEIQ